MHIGEQLSDLSDQVLTWAAQLGVEHIAVQTTRGTGIENADGTWRVSGIRDVQGRLATFGMSMDALALDLPSVYITRQRFAGIMLGSETRDAEIEIIKQNIRAAGEAGVPCLKYNLNVLGVPRTGRTPGRGGARYSHFDIAKWTDHSLTEAGPMPAERMWQAITYFLERTIPLAEECGVRMACHPHDPALPPGSGLRGVDCILGSIDGLKRFIAISPSPYHGLNFCQGTVAEMCENPAKEVIEAIEYFGSRQKIFMVHFRNIKGRFLHFDEVYPDNGDVDMYEAILAYQAIGYEGMLCPDHVPESNADPDGQRQHSFCLGYTRALIQVAERERKGSELS